MSIKYTSVATICILFSVSIICELQKGCKENCGCFVAAFILKSWLSFHTRDAGVTHLYRETLRMALIHPGHVFRHIFLMQIATSCSVVDPQYTH